MITNGFFVEFRHLSSTPKRVVCLLNASVKAFDHVPGHLFRKSMLINWLVGVCGWLVGWLVHVGWFTLFGWFG